MTIPRKNTSKKRAVCGGGGASQGRKKKCKKQKGGSMSGDKEMKTALGVEIASGEGKKKIKRRRESFGGAMTFLKKN